MSRAEKILARMRDNPRGDWTINDVERVCRAYAEHGVRITAPTRGSHYKVRHPAALEILTIPAHRPIKPIYITRLVDFIDTVCDIIIKNSH